MPNTYSVEFIDSKSNSKRMVEVIATTSKQAGKQVEKRGCVVTKVHLIKQGPNAIPQIKHDGKKLHRKTDGLFFVGFLLRVFGVLGLIGTLVVFVEGGFVAGVQCVFSVVMIFGFAELLSGVSTLIKELHELNAKQ